MLTISEAMLGRLLERVATRRGATWLQRIDEAAEALHLLVSALLNEQATGTLVVVLAGPGNTGAVGIAAARRLRAEGTETRLVLATHPEQLHAMAAHQLAHARADGLQPWGLAMGDEEMAALGAIPWQSATLLVDALLGWGIEGNPRGELADLIRLINATRRPILALDRPSGLQGDEGAILSPSVDATATLALGLPTDGLREGWPIVGELWVADIHASQEDYDALSLDPPNDWMGFGGVRRVGLAR